ncbi:hypothetical protein BCH308197_3675 [Bacillus cereus H3081.97]|uniref:hypothetical protein n=1 Tax=Bacillus cereus group TaxID=86661 RepID=UPI00016B72B1|nr:MULTISPECIES: hypothetical protein [Bacillus cereus group]EDZ57031.1 hypothetical protein BCH308197_3675 [Bacillus cereus H3081.97]KLA04200.1 hypothetical protein B4086_3544 [Bacillus cereus]KXI69392.1 hypothetical protein ACS51_12690 [Bacillus cereus]MCC2431336.1 hypothetical protein [Bacillus paranthracis]MDX5913873.1 hypothetical protein [Bacillus cereus group sp. BfR-BA-01026]
MPTYYSEDEYKNILSVSRNERYTVIPNEFFNEISVLKQKINLSKDSKHISFAFSYLYLMTYLYRYAKFHDNKDYEFTEQELKKLLTMSPDSYGKNSVNKIIKRGGILEKLGYIEKVKDYPISYDYDAEEKEFVFSYISEVIADLGEGANKYFNTNSKNRRVNLPVKMFEDRTLKAIDMECSGTLYDVTYTTQIDIRVFIYCMIREKLGLEAFYLHSFIKYKNGFHDDFWRRSIQNIIEDTGLSQTVIQLRLKEMEKHGMVFCTHEDFVVGADRNEMTPNGYMAQEYYKFIMNGSKKKYQRGRVISLKMQEEQKEQEKKVERGTSIFG